MKHTVQVDKKHYFHFGYIKRERWANFWRQLNLVEKSGARRVLEVGVGSGVVAQTLRAMGLEVKTLDIDAALTPDIVGSVTDIPLPDASFDTCLAAEVLEHLPWDDVPKALSELRRVARGHVIITLPYAGSILAARCKAPLLPWVTFMLKVPHFWKTHVFDGQHYWELGKRGRSRGAFRMLAKEAGLSVREEGQSPDDPSHYYFLFSV